MSVVAIPMIGGRADVGWHRTCEAVQVDDVFSDRVDAGRRLASELRARELDMDVVVGLARGGVKVAAEVARALGRPLDALAVRKVGHPWHPEYAIGAVTPGDDGRYVRARDGLTQEQVDKAVDRAKRAADELDGRLHERHEPVRPAGCRVLLVDDGLATGATMIAAVRWARGAGAEWVVVAVPVAARSSAQQLRAEADEVICIRELEPLWSVGTWFEDFAQVTDEEVVRLLDELGAPAVTSASASPSD